MTEDAFVGVVWLLRGLGQYDESCFEASNGVPAVGRRLVIRCGIPLGW